jgi:hypothetical protein
MFAQILPFKRLRRNDRNKAIIARMVSMTTMLKIGAKIKLHLVSISLFSCP